MLKSNLDLQRTKIGSVIVFNKPGKSDERLLINRIDIILITSYLKF